MTSLNEQHEAAHAQHRAAHAGPHLNAADARSAERRAVEDLAEAAHVLLIRLDMEADFSPNVFPGRALRDDLRRALLPFSPTAHGEVL